MSMESQMIKALAHAQEASSKPDAHSFVSVFLEAIGNYYSDDKLCTIIEQLLKASVSDDLGDLDGKSIHLAAAGSVLLRGLQAYLDEYYPDDAMPGQDDLEEPEEMYGNTAYDAIAADRQRGMK